jgi:hypothetical protein
MIDKVHNVKNDKLFYFKFMFKILFRYRYFWAINL